MENGNYIVGNGKNKKPNGMAGYMCTLTHIKKYFNVWFTLVMWTNNSECKQLCTIIMKKYVLISINEFDLYLLA